MDFQWNNFKSRVTKAEEYVNFLSKFSAWSESVYGDRFSSALWQIKNNLTRTIETSSNFLLNVEKQTSGNNNVHLQKFKAVDRAFQANALDGKLMSQCCSFFADVNNLVKRQEKGEMSSTDALIELRRINATFVHLSDEYNDSLDSLGTKGDASEYLGNIIKLTNDTILEAVDTISAKEDFDLDALKKAEISAVKIPNDPIIQSRIDVNKKTIGMIDRTIEEHNENMKQGDMIALEDEVLKTFDALDQAVEDLSEGKDIESNIDSLYNVSRGLSKNVDNLYEKQLQMNATQSDYDFISKQFGDSIDKSINDNVYDWRNYLYDISQTMLEQVKDISENSQSDTNQQFVKSMSSLMLNMTKLYPSEHTNQAVLATEIESFVESLEKENEKNFDTAEMPKEEAINSEMADENDSAQTTNNENLDNWNKNADVKTYQETDVISKESKLKEEINIEENTQNNDDNTANLDNEESYNFSSNDILTETDIEILNSTIKELRKYDWVKHTLLNDGNIHISKSFREALERDELKNEIDQMCAKQPAFEYEGELPFTKSEEMEIRNIIENLCNAGVSQEDIVRTAAFEIKTNSSEGLKETWQTLSAKFNGSHKYFYLAREYLSDVSSEIIKNLNLNKDEGMER